MFLFSFMFVNTCIVFDTNWFPKTQHYFYNRGYANNLDHTIKMIRILILVWVFFLSRHFEVYISILCHYSENGIWAFVYVTFGWCIQHVCTHVTDLKKWSIRLRTSHKKVSYKLKRTAKKRKRPNFTSLLTTCQHAWSYNKFKYWNFAFDTNYSKN